MSGFGTHCHGLVVKVVISHRLDSMIPEVFSDLNSSVIFNSKWFCALLCFHKLHLFRDLEEKSMDHPKQYLECYSQVTVE